MFDEGKTGQCENSAGLIAFVYGECSSSEADTFKAHLLGCADCAAEAAAFRLLRTSLGEMREEALASAPILEIPASKVAPGPSWHESVLALLGGARGLAAAAVVALTLAGIVALYRGGSGPNGNEIAANSFKRGEASAATPTPTGGSSLSPSGGGSALQPLDRKEGDDDKTSVSSKRGGTQRSKSVSIKNTDKVPTLSTYEEEEDKTLRLADLFEDIGE